jgi:dephospho-CoA kinase
MNITTPKRTLAIGVTGGIGSGKSEVCAIFQSLGGMYYSSDIIAKELMNTDPRIKRRINALFGSSMYREDGMLDRKAMAKAIFSNDSLKEKVNAIVHPVVIEYFVGVVEKAQTSTVPSMLFIESALIYDAEIEDLFDYIILVVSDADRSIERVMKRDSVTRTEVMQRQSAQLPPDQHKEKADFTIENNGDLQSLKSNCMFVYRLLAQLS